MTKEELITLVKARGLTGVSRNATKAAIIAAILTDEETVSLDDADVNEDGEYSEEELSALTKAQLLTLVETLNVDGVSSSNTKAQIIAAILAAQETSSDNEGSSDNEDQNGGS